ncbi:hypothetical protein CMV_007380 [Castanea mollissima]|uniref:Uncharacterized protein n=1 Tax=Castanea mollissima TaxID=60419 RepID=A0A8J4RTS5_9ROSI|nr:hypothetical protein CMV_007380 [Castanea mollissima]
MPQSTSREDRCYLTIPLPFWQWVVCVKLIQRRKLGIVKMGMAKQATTLFLEEWLRSVSGCSSNVNSTNSSSSSGNPSDPL